MQEIYSATAMNDLFFHPVVESDETKVEKGGRSAPFFINN
jgi:hypothetical protein